MEGASAISLLHMGMKNNELGNARKCQERTMPHEASQSKESNQGGSSDEESLTKDQTMTIASENRPQHSTR